MHALAFRSPKANRMFHYSLRSRNVAMSIGRTFPNLYTSDLEAMVLPP